MSGEPLWTGKDFAQAIFGEWRGSVPGAVTGISIDSRTIEMGDAFFAILGDRFDGHDFVAGALEAGASVAVVAADKVDTLSDVSGTLLVVDEPLGALEELGRASRARSKARIIGVTGSVGKTSSKEALRAVLSRNGRTFASRASFNNHWGVPLSLSRMPADTEFGVFEIGMNHPGEITPLTKMVRPHIAIITTVEAVHIEFFDSIKQIADAKSEIFDGIEPDGVAVLNADNPHCERLAAAARKAGAEIVTFGTREGVDAWLLGIAEHGDTSSINASILGAEVTYKLGVPGRHQAVNSLAVLTAAAKAGADLALGMLGLADLAPAKGRGARILLEVLGGEILLIDESYNANPASMTAAIGLLGAAPTGPRGRRIAVIADMLELGDDAEELHKKLASPLAEASVDLVFAAGSHMRALWQALESHRRGEYAEKAEDLTEPVAAALRAGDVVMVKGSLGSRTGPIVQALEKRFGPRGA